MHLIFDFDGTLVDSFNTVIEKFNQLADEYNFKQVSSEELIKLRDIDARELIKHLKIPLHKIPPVLYKARKLLNNEIPKLVPFLTIPQVLKKMHAANISLGILTSNSKENVITWLNINKMKDFFSFIHIESNYFGKNRVLKKMLKRYGINKSEAFYVGDEVRDIDAAKQNGIYSIAVTWGFNSEKILSQYQPHFIARKPEDLLTVCGLQTNIN